MKFGAMAAAFLAVFSGVPAWSATVTELAGPPIGGMSVALQVGDFARAGNCGGGTSVVNDGCSVVMKEDPAAAHAYGRFEPLHKYWVDSQDIDDLKWTATAPTAFTSLTFALTDAHDQANSHFEMLYSDGSIWKSIWNIPERLANGNLFWLTVEFGKAVTGADFRFTTKTGHGYDGFGISMISVQPAPVPVPLAQPAPVPVPPSALLMASGAALMAALRRRKTA